MCPYSAITAHGIEEADDIVACRLPTEIRLQIPEATIGGRTTSFTMRDRLLRQGTGLVNGDGQPVGLVRDRILLPLLTCVSKMVCNAGGLVQSNGLQSLM